MPIARILTTLAPLMTLTVAACVPRPGMTESTEPTQAGAGAANTASCPSNAELASQFGPVMVTSAPAGTTWTGPTIDLCAPIATPTAGFYVIGHVHQDSPDRDFQFHFAIEQQTQAMFANSKPSQLSSHDACAYTLAGNNGATVDIKQDCTDKMGHATTATLTATVATGHITVASH